MTIVPYLETTCQCQPGVSTIFRYISLDSHYKDLTTLCRNVTKSQPPQSNSRNALPGSNNSGSNSFQSVVTTSTKKSVPASRVSGTGTSAKSRTTSVNGVAVTRSDTGSNSKSKKPSNLKKSRVIEISDLEDSDSDTLEREAALASPAKGAESRKASTKVSKNFIYVR
jgi:hypothetical protein